MNWKTTLLGVGAAGVVGAILGTPRYRRTLVSKPIMDGMKAMGLLPKISETERTAIEAGSVWVDGELFSGRPDFRRLLSEPYPGLTPEEQTFLDGPAEELCRLVDDWEVWQRRGLSDAAWAYMKQERFFGMIIPEAYGGLGFSASANSAVVAKLAARSQVLGITVMVPNSLGPAELLIHYGTDEQRRHYLPRLARGEEIPCFALTEAGAGSDAGSIESYGDVFRGDDGALYLRLNWKKRYITLGAIATVLGLAFKLRDPEGLLGRGTDLGITCALISTATPGVSVGMRHDPMGVPFYNSPVEGRDVVVPIDAIIGGAEGAGMGWRMLMECLAAGRGISLPATSTGGAKLVYRVASGHAAVRRQFGLPIGRFEGIEEPLARIGGMTYIMEAARRYTNGALDGGAKPAVVTAIMKHATTEMARQVVNDGMDILGGNAIARGPRNLIASAYIGTPIGITVEGANILTRTLMIFGQGAIRCHPYAIREIRALGVGDLKAFDGAFWGHAGHVLRNVARAAVLSLTRGRLASTPVDGPAGRYVQKLAWASATFAVMADLAMGSLGGELKRKEKITGRFADVLSWMYLATAVLRRFEAEGRRAEELPFFRWAMEYAFGRIQEGFDGIFENMHVPVLGALLRGPGALWCRLNPIGSAPADHLGHEVAAAMQTPGPLRDRHTAGLYLPRDREEALGRLEYALQAASRADRVERKIRDAVKNGRLARAKPEHLVHQAVSQGIVSPDEAEIVVEAERARNDYIQVDAFTTEDYGALYGGGAAPPSRPLGMMDVPEVEEADPQADTSMDGLHGKDSLVRPVRP